MTDTKCGPLSDELRAKFQRQTQDPSFIDSCYLDMILALDDALLAKTAECVEYLDDIMGAAEENEALKTRLRALTEALEANQTRMKYIKNGVGCIGLDMTHVDGNCPYCLVKYAIEKTGLALAAHGLKENE